MSEDPGPPLPLTAAVREALIERLTALGDDELVLGHRDSEWTGHGPILEEDIAIANVAQDEIGHAVLWYELVQGLGGPEPDELAFTREAVAFRSTSLVEQPKGDWAFTMLRQFLFDSYEAELLPRLMRSSYAPVAEVAAKVNREELFHLRHSALWLERLAHGTDESRRRLVAALDTLWPLLPQLLAPLPGDAALTVAGIYPDTSELEGAVMQRITGALERVDVAPPKAAAARSEPSDRRARSSGGPLVALLAEMQSVARNDPLAEGW